MEACIIVFSQTGHTALFARAIAEKLRENGHEADIELLRTTSFLKPNSRNISFRKVPDTSSYDIILIGAPIWAFRVCPALGAYISTIKTLKSKRAAAFLTHGLPFGSFGVARRELGRLSTDLELLGADTVEGELLHSLFAPNKQRMDNAASRLAERITAS